jgi:ATPase subunit of ABC transporter with duplicated ATPase domains
MSSINLTQLGWSTPDGRTVLSGLDLGFGRERVGLVGCNGAGKTTLLHLIAGDLQPLTGSVSVNGTLGLLKQAVQVTARQTVGDLFGASEALAVLRRAEAGEAGIDELATADWTLEDRIAAALGRVGLAAASDTPLAQLSGGQRTRASLAAMIFIEPDFLLLDEPTNNLDRSGRKALIELLASWRSGAVIVSHDRELLEHMDTIVELTSLGATRYGGNWSRYREQKAIEMEAARNDLAHAEKKAAEVDRGARLAAERQDRRSAAGSRKAKRGDLPRILLGKRKNAAEASRGNSQNIVQRQRLQAQAAAEAARARLEIRKTMSITLPSTDLATGRRVLNLEDVTAGYDIGRPLIRALSFSIVGPERVAFVGPNGSGKTTLLKLISGQMKPFHGTVSVDVEFAMLDQSVSILDPAASILDNFMRLNPASNENACRSTLAAFLFRADAALQPVGTLSGGQMLRAGLGCVLGGPQPPQMLVLDEPTNHLDIDSVEAIEAGLTSYDGALLVVSHDETFLASIGTERKLDLAA